MFVAIFGHLVFGDRARLPLILVAQISREKDNRIFSWIFRLTEKY
jgi:hypothetical protein